MGKSTAAGAVRRNLGKKRAADFLSAAKNDLLMEIFTHQNLEQLIAVDLADERAGLIMVGDIGGIFGQDIAYDLVDRVVAFFFKSLIHRQKNAMDLSILLLGKIKLAGKLVHFLHHLSLDFVFSILDFFVSVKRKRKNVTQM